MNCRVFAWSCAFVLCFVAAVGASRASAEKKRVTVEPLFGFEQVLAGPFPSDRFAVPDGAQNTCERVNLTKPPLCDGQESECLEIDLLNQLDGFNIKPRLSIPFSGPIDLSTAESANIFLISLGDTLRGGVPSCALPRLDDDEDDDDRAPRIPTGAGSIVGIDESVWDPATSTLYTRAAELLDQHTRYLLLVTKGVKDTHGNPVKASKAFKRAIGDDDDEDEDEPPSDPTIDAYKHTLRRAVHIARFFGVRRSREDSRPDQRVTGACSGTVRHRQWRRACRV